MTIKIKPKKAKEPKQIIRLMALVFVIMLFIPEDIRSQDFWDSIPYPDTVDHIPSITVIGRDTVLIGTNLTRSYNGGIYLSPDKGETWEFIGPYRRTPYAILKGEEDTLFMGGTGGVWRSPDWGNTWEWVWEHFNNVLCLHKTQNNTLLAGTWGGIIRSLDNGKTWDTCIWQDLLIRTITSDDNGTIYAGGRCYSGQYDNFYYSIDNGETFIGIPTPGMAAIYSLKINSSDELFAGCLMAGLFKSNDGGFSWEPVIENKDISDIIITEDDEIFLACDNHSWLNGGILYSPDNGVFWDDITYNIENKYFKKIAISSDNYVYVVSNAGFTSFGSPFNRSINQFVSVKKYKNHSFFVFPNPCSSKLTIQLPEYKMPSKTDVLLFDMNGKTVCRWTLNIFNSGNCQINIDTIPSGSYVLCIKSENNILSRKIVIQ